MIYTVTKKQYIKYPHYYDVIDDKVKQVYARCPNCNSYISIYKGELDENGLTKLSKTCTCHFAGRLQLEQWETQ